MNMFEMQTLQQGPVINTYTFYKYVITSTNDQLIVYYVW